MFWKKCNSCRFKDNIHICDGCTLAYDKQPTRWLPSNIEMGENANMKYRVFNKTTKEDITDKRDWVITPNGELRFNDYGDLIGDSNAMYINELGVEEFKKTLKALDNIKE